MPFPLWFTVAGGVLIAMALAGTVLKRLPLTTALVYLAIGVGLSPLGIGLLPFDPVRDAVWLERLAEVAVTISLFTAGLKLHAPLRDGRWKMPIRLATVSMVATVGLVAAVAYWGLGLPLGVAILLGAALAPTDPVLASEVQVDDTTDRDRLRFGLTGEAGLNDGSAFPFVMLGLGLLGHHELGTNAWRWVAVDVVWASVGGLAIGAACGLAVGRLVLYLRREHKEALGTDDFLALGLVALSYGLAVHAKAYGFLAVFAAGLALRNIERKETGVDAPAEPLDAAALAGTEEELAADTEKAPAYMTQAVLGFTEQFERIGEVAMVVLVGAALVALPFPSEALWFIPLLFLVVRPLAVWIGLLGAPVTRLQKGLAGWFGLRGIGSLYYIAFAVAHGVEGPTATTLMSLTMWTIAASVVVHGVSVTPLMNRYRARVERYGGRRVRRRAQAPAGSTAANQQA